MIVKHSHQEITDENYVPDLIFITGQCGSGKSTLSRMLSTKCGFLTFHTGSVYQHHFGATVAGTDNPDAPKDADPIIKQALFDFIEREKHNLPIVIETAPRSFDSVRWLEELARLGYKSLVIMMKADPEIRHERVKNRDLLNSGRAEMDKDKIGGEKKFWYENMFELLSSRCIPRPEIWNVPATVADMDQCVDWLEAKSCLSRSEKMYNSALNVWHERDAYQNHRPNFRRMLERMTNELDETKTAEHPDHQFEELMDVLHFMFCAAKALGIDSGDVFEKAFKKKTHVNQMRLHYGTKELPSEIINGAYWKNENY